MSALHVLSSSPFGDSNFQRCLSLLSSGDGLLLCADAVYAAIDKAILQQLETLAAHHPISALEEDLTARGLSAPATVEVIDYSGFVRLSLQHDKVTSWP